MVYGTSDEQAFQRLGWSESRFNDLIDRIGALMDEAEAMGWYEKPFQSLRNDVITRYHLTKGDRDMAENECKIFESICRCR
jgi:hypothetical protein